MKTISPTQSYFLKLPDDVVSDQDDRVFSWWRNGSEVLLQLSSYLRIEGPQVSAKDRLNDRLSQTNFLLSAESSDLSIDCPDIAFASGIDSEGIQWFYYYLVWPDLAIMATISGESRTLKSEGRWAIEALNSFKKGMESLIIQRKDGNTT